MGFTRVLLTSFAILHIYTGPGFCAPTDVTADDVATEDSYTIDIQVYNDEQHVGVVIVDPDTYDSVDSADLYGGTGGPDSTEKPFPISIYDSLPNDTIVVHLVRNGTSDIIATKSFAPIADKLRKDGPRAIDIYSDALDGVLIVRVINRRPGRSIIIMLTDEDGVPISDTSYIYRSNGTELPIVIPLHYSGPPVPIIFQVYDAETGKVEGLKALIPVEIEDDEDDDDDEDGDDDDDKDDDEDGDDDKDGDKDEVKGGNES